MKSNNTLIRQRSPKPIKKLDECVVPFYCIFPKEAATDRDKVTKKLCVSVGVGMDIAHFPVEEKVDLPYKFWSLLKDINFKYLPRYGYDPIRTSQGWYPF